VLAAVLIFLGLTTAQVQAAPARPIEVRVVIITTWEVEKDGKDVTGELHAWRTNWPLTTELAFPLGVHPLLYDPNSHVLAIVTGEATARAAASIMALGTDPRFDLSHAYWILAGTAGVDPGAASAGSAAWERWVVDGDLSQEIDSRDLPPDWPTGIVPFDRTKPYETPAPPIRTLEANMAFKLNPALVDWAYARTRDLKLSDDPTLAALRAPYSGKGALPPFVLEGDGLMAARFWYGARLNDWARQWVPYWTGGQGVFVMSAEEDTGVMESLTQLAAAHRIDLDRVLLLRGASDYTVEPPGMTAAAFLAKENADDFPGAPAALEDLYETASPIARYLTVHWSETRDRIPNPDEAAAR
jgi:purine nucleoside permease